MTLDLEPLKAMCEAATAEDLWSAIVGVPCTPKLNEANRAFVYRSRTALPELIAEIDRQREKIAELERHFDMLKVELGRAQKIIEREENRAETAERERDEARAECERLAILSQAVMDCLEEAGAKIVPHLLDTDDNVGQFLRVVAGHTLGDREISDLDIAKARPDNHPEIYEP